KNVENFACSTPIFRPAATKKQRPGIFRRTTDPSLTVLRRIAESPLRPRARHSDHSLRPRAPFSDFCGGHTENGVGARKIFNDCGLDSFSNSAFGCFSAADPRKTLKILRAAPRYFDRPPQKNSDPAFFTGPLTRP
ncbi:MAG: hypothetical protein ACOYJH_05070, partial [Anaerovoracaceae bacterium]